MDTSFESEKLLLESIFGDSFIDLSTTDKSSNFAIKLVPHPGQQHQNHVYTTVEFKYSYMSSSSSSLNVPHVRIIDSQGLTPSELDELYLEIKNHLKELSKESNDSIYNLTLFIEEWLLLHNDEYRSNPKKQSSIRPFSWNNNDDKKDFIHIYDDSIDDIQQVKDKKSGSLDSISLLPQKKRILYTETEVIYTNQKNNFRLIKGVNLSNHRCVFIKEYSIFPSDVHIDSIDRKKVEFIKRIIWQINQFSATFNDIDHENICKIIGADFFNYKINIYIDFAGLTLLSHFQKIKVFDEHEIKKYIKQIIEGMSFLHHYNLFDISLNITTMFIDHLGRIKMSDYLCYSQINDLLNNFDKLADSSFNDYLWPSDSYNLEESTKNEKISIDIKRIADLLLTFTNSHQEESIPLDYYSFEMVDFYKKCKEGYQLSSLKDHPFLSYEDYDDISISNRSYFIPLTPDQSFDQFNSIVSNNQSSYEVDDHNDDILFDETMLYETRYFIEFTELEMIGEGGFGKVFKVRNKLDGYIYAIKKIQLYPTMNEYIINKIRREVATLSSLSHQHVVRYYQTWIGNENNDDKKSKNPYKKILYIQMEYCSNKNLSMLIKEGLNEDYAMMLFRQIIEGLNHIHSKGFIHRDLKPSNILIDQEGNAKIGDFGLAINNHNPILNNNKDDDDDDLSLESYGENNDEYEKAFHTSFIGTRLYLAPEQLNNDGSNQSIYDQKIDIYSLGITFFEMFYSFSSNKERFITLTNLRKGIIPKDFPKAHLELLTSLISKNPDLRPTTTDLLSNVLRLGENIMKEAMTYISKPNTAMYSILMDKLFSNEHRTEQMNYIYHLNESDRPSHIETKLRMEIVKNVEKIFINHGAQYIETPSFIPKSILLECSHNVNFLDPSGSILNAPSDLTLPFVYYIVQNCIQNTRRYVIDKVYRKEIGKPNIVSKRVMNFDMIGSTSSKSIMIIEMFHILLEISASLSKKQTPIIVINHFRLLDQVLSFLSYDLQVQKRIRSSLKRNRFKTWQELYKSILDIDKVNEKNIMNVIDLFHIRKIPLIKSIDMIVSIFNRFPHHLSVEFEKIREIIRYSKMFNLSELIHFDISLVHKHKYCHDFSFQLIVGGKEIVNGYCYDKLIQKVNYSIKTYRNDYGSSMKDISGICISIDIHKIARLMMEEIMRRENQTIHHNIHNNSRKNELVDVFIYSDQYIKQMDIRLLVAYQCWASNIKAEYIYDEFASMESLMSSCKEKGITWFIHIKSTNHRRGIQNFKKVVIRNLNTKMEESIDLNEVSVYLQKKMESNMEKEIEWNIQLDEIDIKDEERGNINKLAKSFIEISRSFLKFFDKENEIRVAIVSKLNQYYVEKCGQIVNGKASSKLIFKDDEKQRYKDSFEKLKFYLIGMKKRLVPFVFVYVLMDNSYVFITFDGIK